MIVKQKPANKYDVKAITKLLLSGSISKQLKNKNVSAIIKPKIIRYIVCSDFKKSNFCSKQANKYPKIKSAAIIIVHNGKFRKNKNPYNE